jgi:hypothetical protein
MVNTRHIDLREEGGVEKSAVSEVLSLLSYTLQPEIRQSHGLGQTLPVVYYESIK